MLDNKLLPPMMSYALDVESIHSNKMNAQIKKLTKTTLHFTYVLA